MSYLVEQLMQLSREGGWIFWALIALAFGIAFALISIVHFLRFPHAPRLPARDWLSMLGREGATDEAVARLVPVAGELPLIEQQLFSQLERRIRFAFVLIAAAPLVGLLGTVSGMLATFHGMASKLSESPMDVISGGVSEALITTQTGLVIAVPVNIAYNIFVSRIDQLIVDMEHGAQKILNIAWDLEKDGHIEIMQKEDDRWPAKETAAAKAAAATAPAPPATPETGE